MQDTLIYLHGFLSSPQSVKAQQTQKFVQQNRPDINLVIPELPNYPQQAADTIAQLIEQYSDRLLGFIGSSMGGFFSTYFAEQTGTKAVLINPAVRPFELLADYLGDHINPYTDKAFTLTQDHIHQLIGFDTPTVTRPDRYWALLQTGDETLDYRQAVDKYAHSKLTIEEGGDHSFQGYERFLSAILDFFDQAR